MITPPFKFLNKFEIQFPQTQFKLIIDYRRNQKRKVNLERKYMMKMHNSKIH